jgi:predicted NUDIX family NTP pyrophosphohydrolase
MMYRRRHDSLEVFLVHPGGPYWANKNLGAWTIPKGEYAENEQGLDAAKREFQEETGFVPEGNYLPLGEVKQNGGKIVAAWAFEGDCDPSKLSSNLCQIEWPPGSGTLAHIPEMDRGSWFSIVDGMRHILKGQEPLLDRLIETLRVSG